MFSSLRARYYVVVVGLATIPVLLLGIFAGLRSADEFERRSLILQNELAARVERDIASFISDRQSELRVFERTNVLAEMSKEEITAGFGRLLAHDQVYQELFILTGTGQVEVFASRTDIMPRYSEHWSQAQFLEPDFWSHESTYLGPVEFDAELREPLLDIAIPVINRRTGDVTRILLAHVRFKPIWDLLADIDLPGETEAFVVSDTGQVLAHRSPAKVLSESVYDMPTASGRHPLADGRPGLVAFKELSLVGKPTFVVVTRPLDAALASAREMRTATLVSAVVLLFAASLLALHQSRQIVRPVEKLAAAARRISAGDLDTKIELSGPQEIQALGRTMQDMAARLKETISDLKRSEFVQRQRAMVTLESIGDAVITTDPDGVVTYINPVAEELTGWTEQEAVDQNLTDVFRIVDEASRAPAPNPVTRCLASGKIVGLANDTVLLSRGGREYSISDSAAPIREAGGKVIGVVVVFRDVTERKGLERSLRQSQKMEAIGRLSGGIAHDFNNLMQVIRGNAELLMDDPGTDPSVTTPILRAVERGAELTQRLLAYARKQPLMPRAVDVSKLLQDMLAILDRALGEPIEVSLFTDPDTWPAQADPGQLETAILNLALNARDAMPNGGQLVIRCANVTRNGVTEDRGDLLAGGEFVSITVSDNGEGMNADTRKRAIDPFFTTKGVGQGSGLGLSMVYGFVMQSGGHLDIESEEHAGTTITMLLPRAKAPPPSSRTETADDNMQGNGETVLVVEDNPEVRELARRMLESLGYRAIEAATVAEAQVHLDQGVKVDLVLSDVVLPGGASGLEFARELMQSRPDLPVALMSGYPDVTETGKGEADLEIILLNKPFQRAELAAILHRLLGRPPGSGSGF